MGQFPREGAAANTHSRGQGVKQQAAQELCNHIWQGTASVHDTERVLIERCSEASVTTTQPHAQHRAPGPYSDPGSHLCRIGNCLVFQKELIIEDFLPIPPYTHHLLCVKTSPWCGWQWFITLAPRSLFHATLLCTIHFSSSTSICFKNRMLSLSRGPSPLP